MLSPSIFALVRIWDRTCAPTSAIASTAMSQLPTAVLKVVLAVPCVVNAVRAAVVLA